MKRIVITGPTGAIGMALIEQMVSSGVEVLALVRKESRRSARIPNHKLVQVAECSLEEMKNISVESINPERKKYDVFYHFAWEATIGAGRNDMYAQNRNVTFALDAVELAEKLGCHTFIGAGSQAEYGRVEGKVSSDSTVNPENGYGIAKFCAGQMTRILCQSKQIRHIWTRILSIYGPYDGDQTMVCSTIQKLLKGEVPEFTAGEQQWDYLYSKDAARALALLGESGRDGCVYPIGSGQIKTLKEYILKIRDAVSPSSRLGFGAVPYGEKQVMYLCADISELMKDTGFSPAVSFETGIRETVEWCRKEYENGYEED